jgi:hypothetical protein
MRSIAEKRGSVADQAPLENTEMILAGKGLDRLHL